MKTMLGLASAGGAAAAMLGTTATAKSIAIDLTGMPLASRQGDTTIIPFSVMCNGNDRSNLRRTAENSVGAVVKAQNSKLDLI
jgi:hypothetical protein